MGAIKTLERFLLELRSVEGEPRTDGPYPVAWADGRMWIDPDTSGRDWLVSAGMRGPVVFTVDPTDRTIRYAGFDDYTDFRHIKRAQQALADLVRAGAVDGSWDFYIGSSKSASRASLGSLKVSKVLAFNADFDRVVPFAFHGTTTYHLDRIKRFGLQPRAGSGADMNWDRFYTPESDGLVYLTISLDRARYYAEYAVDHLRKEYGIEAEPAVLRFRNLPLDAAALEDDLSLGVGHAFLRLVIASGGKSPEQLAKKDPVVMGIRSSGQFALARRLPWSMVDRVMR